MKILQSKIFQQHNNIIHGISTKAGGGPPFYNNLSKHVGDSEENIKQNRERFFGALGIQQEKLVHANQVHSNNVKIVQDPGLYRETDGFITDKTGLFLVISIADCMPAMIFDKRNNIIANIHAGWRGTQKKIVSHAMEILIDEYKSKPEDISVFLGPCISKKNFEVGEEVAEIFDARFIEKRNNRFYADIAADNTAQLKSFGLKDEQIESSGICTYGEAERMHSYRRDGQRSGRMFAVIGLSS
jgi:purine-nucleoside/S-methyl-5'-thioadenosine phosphorylase / adenosine deaminase